MNEIKYFNFSNDYFQMLTTISNHEDEISKVLESINLNTDKLCYIEQIHSNNCKYVKTPGNHGQADGMICNNTKKLILSIVTADCVPIFIYDNLSGLYGLVHAGWKGVVSKIHINAVEQICNLDSKKENLSVFLGPGIKQCCFEIKEDIINNFSTNYVKYKMNKMFLNLNQIIITDLIEFGLKSNNISFSEVCTYDDRRCHSFRRDGDKAKRMFSIISPK